LAYIYFIAIEHYVGRYLAFFPARIVFAKVQFITVIRRKSRTVSGWISDICLPY